MDFIYQHDPAIFCFAKLVFGINQDQPPGSGKLAPPPEQCPGVLFEHLVIRPGHQPAHQNAFP